MKREKWSLWWADVKFEDSDEVKTRPVLIINNTVFAITAYKVTSLYRGDAGNEFVIKEWKEAGLNKPSAIRLGRVLQLQEKDISDYIGRLSPVDELKLIRRMFSPK